MARDRTLPAWPDPLRLLLEYFLDAPLSSKRGEGRGLFFFFLGFDWSALTESTSIWLTCPAVLEGPLGSLGPIKGLWAPFWLISYLLFTPHSPHNFLEHLELCGFVLLASIFHFSQLFLSILHLRPVSIFLLLSVFFF